VQINGSLWVSVIFSHKGHALVACCFVIPSAASQRPLPGTEEIPFYSDSNIVLMIY
jgi:hypothetical protein